MIKARQRGVFLFCLLQRKEQIRGEVGGKQTGGLVGIQQTATLVLEEAVGQLRVILCVTTDGCVTQGARRVTCNFNCQSKLNLFKRQIFLLNSFGKYLNTTHARTLPAGGASPDTAASSSPHGKLSVRPR